MQYVRVASSTMEPFLSACGGFAVISLPMLTAMLCIHVSSPVRVVFSHTLSVRGV
jgi:hypothetical protein